MFGVEPLEIVLLFRQLGLVVAGAAAFWGAIFIFISRRSPKREGALWHGAAQKLLWAFFPALFFYGITSWLLFIDQCIFCAYAHEGISLPMYSEGAFADILTRQYPLFTAILIFALAGFIALALPKTQRFFLKNLWGYGILFLAISALLVYPWEAHESLRHAISSALHNWHSILTLGSVIVADYIFLIFRHNLIAIIPRVFSLITSGIWIGLGLDFLSSGLIFQDAFFINSRFLFAQTIVGILIINGVILSGPLARRLLRFKSNKMPLPAPLNRLIGISGAVSFAGWMSITAIDGFRNLTLSYPALLGAYVLFAALVFAAREGISRIIPKDSLS